MDLGKRFERGLGAGMSAGSAAADCIQHEVGFGRRYVCVCGGGGSVGDSARSDAAGSIQLEVGFGGREWRSGGCVA